MARARVYDRERSPAHVKVSEAVPLDVREQAVHLAVEAYHGLRPGVPREVLHRLR